MTTNTEHRYPTREAAQNAHSGAPRPIGSKCQPTCHRPSATQAHCSVCHHSLSGVSYFDSHRVNGFCVAPASLGLVERDGLWSTPEGHEKRASDGARLAAARSQRSATPIHAEAGDAA